MERVSVERLRQVLRYAPRSGNLYWLERDNKAFNTRFAGKRAFTYQNVLGYFVGSVDGVCLLAHRVGFALHTGAWPIGVLDHRDNNPGNNRIFNLRDCGHVQNLMNSSSRPGSSSQYKGVSIYPPTGKWRARVGYQGKTILIGYFDDEEEAARAYDRAVVEFHGPIARTNFYQD